MMCKYNWYDNYFEKKRAGVWNMEIKRMNYGCAYYDVAHCKRIDIFTTTKARC